ncbi:MAG: hypothetical protein EHM53_09945, partial [Methanoregulaceae archaeon]
MKRLIIFLCVFSLLVMPALADITTFYADTVDDGRLSRAGVIENFSDIRSGAGTQASLTTASTETSFLLTTGSSPEKWATMRGFYWKASTAGIPDNAVIDSATMGFSSVSNCVYSLGSFNITLSNFTEADTGTGLTTDDYNTLSGLVLSDIKNTAQWNVDGYKNFTLNADGLSAINKTGNTTIALNFWRTLTNNAPAWSASKSSYCYVYDTSAGISKAPFLEVTYHVGTPTPTPTPTLTVPTTIQIPTPTPPESITRLINTTPMCSNVTFAWDNPPDSDYGELLVWRNNTGLSNLTNTTTSV